MKYCLPPRTLIVLLLLVGLSLPSLRAQTLLPAVPPHPAPDLAAPTQLLLHKKYAQAVALLNKLIPKHENQAELHVMLAYAYFRLNKPAKSLKEYTRSAQLRHPTAEDLKWVALDYVLLKDYKDAEKWMYHSLQMNPKDEFAWYSMGRILYTRSLFKKALICFDQALKLNPHSVNAENNLGLTYAALYKWDDAIAAYKNAIAWQQGSTHLDKEPFLNLGIVYLNQNHLDKALPLLQKAYSLDPHSKRILTQLAQANYRLGHYSDAEKELKSALTIAPKDSGLHFQLGRVLSKEGKTAEAKIQFAKVAELDKFHSYKP